MFSLANHANEVGESCFPSIATIAREAKLSERQVQRSIRSLEALGELEVAVGIGPKGVNGYRLIGMRQPSLLPQQQVTDCQGDKLSPPDKSDQRGRQIEHEGVTNPTKRGDSHVTQTVINSNEQSESRAAACGKVPMSAGWTPPLEPMRWLIDSGMSQEERQETIREFRDWVRDSGHEKTPAEFTQMFYRNPKVKSAVSRARARASRGERAESERDRQQIRGLAEMMQMKQNPDETDSEFRDRVLGRNNLRIKRLQAEVSGSSGQPVDSRETSSA